MARPGLIAALLLPLPFAALPLVAVLLGGPMFSPEEDTVVYAPVSAPALHDDQLASLAKWQGLADSLTNDCDDLGSGT